jgi:hypothetical protein
MFRRKVHFCTCVYHSVQTWPNRCFQSMCIHQMRKNTDSLKNSAARGASVALQKSASEPGSKSDKRNFTKTYGQMDERNTKNLEGIDWDSVQAKWSSDVSGAETSWLGPITTKALHARLLCGIRFFDKNDRLIGNVPACAVKQVCKILTILDKRGELVEELSQVEKDFARNGLETLRSAPPHASCFSCTQLLCPVNPKHPLK